MGRSKKQMLNLEHLTFKALQKIAGGAIGVACDKEFRKAILDCEDCPDLAKPRTVTLKVAFIPRMTASPMGGRTEYAGCDVGFTIGGVIPGKELVVVMAKDDDGQGLLFNPDSEDNPDQMTLGNGE